MKERFTPLHLKVRLLVNMGKIAMPLKRIFCSSAGALGPEYKTITLVMSLWCHQLELGDLSLLTKKAVLDISGDSRGTAIRRILGELLEGVWQTVLDPVTLIVFVINLSLVRPPTLWKCKTRVLNSWFKWFWWFNSVFFTERESLHHVSSSQSTPFLLSLSLKAKRKISYCFAVFGGSLTLSLGRCWLLNSCAEKKIKHHQT